MNVPMFFEEVLKKPELYLGIKSISRLEAFMSGYTTAAQTFNPEIDLKFLWNFYHWVSKEYESQTTHSWASVILFMELHDEYKAFEKTKELWYTYKQEQH